MASTGSIGPVSAAMAARCEIFATLEVIWDCKFATALAMSAGAISQPTRHPVIANVLATPLTMIVVAAASGTSAGSEAAVTPRSEEHTSELQSRGHLVCRLLLEKKN